MAAISSQIKSFLEAQPLAHRPPLPVRYWFYCAAAYLVPVAVQIGFPEDPTLTDELIWLVTLAPAFLLSLHYGLMGSFAALLFGTALFIVVQYAVGALGIPDDWRITVPTYIAYSALSISVGWLSEQLHEHYKESLGKERLAAIGEMVVAVNHEVNNALTPLLSETELLLVEGRLSEEQRESLESIKGSAKRIADVVDKLTRLEDTPVTTYVGRTKMIDLAQASLAHPPDGRTRPKEDE